MTGSLPTMPRSWPEIVVALERLGAASPVVRPGLYGRVMQRLRAAEEPRLAASCAPPDDREEGDAPPLAHGT